MELQERRRLSQRRRQSLRIRLNLVNIIKWVLGEPRDHGLAITPVLGEHRRMHVRPEVPGHRTADSESWRILNSDPMVSVYLNKRCSNTRG